MVSRARVSPGQSRGLQRGRLIYWRKGFRSKGFRRGLAPPAGVPSAPNAVTMSSTPHHIYLRDFDPDGQSSLAKIARRVGPGTTILDLGIGPGILGKYLATSKGCVIDGVEYHPQQAEMAAPAYRKVQVADLEQTRLADLFPGIRYDIIICADVLEHLRDPGRIIDQLPELLKPAGRVLLSVPTWPISA